MSHSLNKDFAEHLPEDLSRVWTSTQVIPAAEWTAVHLTLDNDGSTRDMNVDGTTPKRFQYVVPDGKAFILSRVIWSAADLNIQYLDWMGFGAELTNGCLFRVMESDGTTLIKSFLHALVNTIEFAHLAGADVPLLRVNVGVVPDAMTVRWTLARAGFVPIFTAGEIIEFVIQDNLAAMDHFECAIQGRVFDH